MQRRWRWFLQPDTASVDLIGQVAPYGDVPGRYRRPAGEGALPDGRVTSRCDGALVYERLDQERQVEMSVRNQRRLPVRGGAVYRSRTYPSLLPWQVRERRFPPTRLGRRGLKPDEVYDFLERVAADMMVLYDEITKQRQENLRIKAALRRWQSEQAKGGHR
jgi:DivIVA domain-containing protein